MKTEKKTKIVTLMRSIARMIDLTNKKYGKLTVIKLTGGYSKARMTFAERKRRTYNATNNQKH